MFWNQHIPSKVGFFAWEVWWGKVLTSTQLKKRGFHLASMCRFCRKEEEELEHILIHCHAIWRQWTDLLLAFGVDWTCHFLAKDLIQSWIHFPVRKKAKAIWRAAPLLLFWAIWKERNIIIFEDVIFPQLRLKLSVIRLLFTWGGFIPKVDIEFVRLLYFRFYGYA